MLRNAALNLTQRNLFAQVFSGHRDMRDLYEAMIALNQVIVEAFPHTEKGVFSELLVKRISGFSIPAMYRQCHSYFYNAVEELKKPKQERQAQLILKARYDVADIESVGIDMMYLRAEAVSQVMAHCFSCVDSGYTPEQFYSEEFIPTHHCRLSTIKKQIEYHEEAVEERGNKKRREEALRMESNLGLFAIGCPFPPTALFCGLLANTSTNPPLQKGSNASILKYLELQK